MRKPAFILQLSALSLALLLATLPVWADLTVTVYPGYQFSAGERPTTDTLNLAARPTVAVSGTLGGTNVALGANTVTGTMLSDTVADDVTLDWNGSTPRALEIKAAGVNTNQVNTNLFAGAIAGGGGYAVTSRVDGVTITINGTNQLSLQTNIPISYISNFNATVQSLATVIVTNYANTNIFTTGEYALSNGLIADTNHGLAALPSLVNWVLVCKTNNAGFVVGDEVSVNAFTDTSGDNFCAFAGGANSTNVFLTSTAVTGLKVASKAGAGRVSVTAADWKAKGYARP